jgi:hypothetical protein
MRASRWLLKHNKGKLYIPKGLNSSTFIYNLDNLNILYPGEQSTSNYNKQYWLGNVTGVNIQLNRLRDQELYQSYQILDKQSLLYIT